MQLATKRSWLSSVRQAARPCRRWQAAAVWGCETYQEYRDAVQAASRCGFYGPKDVLAAAVQQRACAVAIVTQALLADEGQLQQRLGNGLTAAGRELHLIVDEAHNLDEAGNDVGSAEVSVRLQTAHPKLVNWIKWGLAKAGVVCRDWCIH